MKLKLHAYILCLDSMPYIRRQVEVFTQLALHDVQWHLHLIEGVADNVADTSWVKKIPPRLSVDGTSEFLTSLIGHPNISVYRRQLWPGKVSMVNAALSQIKDECVLMQIDSDECWRPDQLAKVVDLFSRYEIDSMRFLCRYFLGQQIVATGRNCWSNRAGEWHRAWHFKPGMVALKHEPPILQGCGPICMTREQTEAEGLIFDHFAYATRAQCQFKEKYYGYTRLVQQWDRLQANTKWPVKRLADYFPFAGEGVGADLLKSS